MGHGEQQEKITGISPPRTCQHHKLFTDAKIFTKLALQRSSAIVRGLALHENYLSSNVRHVHDFLTLYSDP